MCARRVEAQFRWDADLNPGIWSLAFASKVNLALSMAYSKSQKRLQNMAEDDQESGFGEAAKRIYRLLHEGEYWDEARQKRMPMNGNVSKLPEIIGLNLVRVKSDEASFILYSAVALYMGILFS